jgi:uncharacterized protein YdeI (YjbR/CyaY-like superfamily)
MSEPTFFATPEPWRAWLAEHSATSTELLVGFHKKGSGRPSITWPESVDEALCFGWIDGVRRRIDDESYAIRFTPRSGRSTWSAVNIRRVAELTAEGRMQPAGLAAFEQRSVERSVVYSYEQEPASTALPAEYEERLRADAAAAEFFDRQPASYRRAVIHWITTAKQETTRLRRLDQLMAECAQGRRLRQFVSPGKQP